MEEPPSLVRDLQKLVLDLRKHPFPHVPNPPSCKKRASVALILRIQPSFPDIATYTSLNDSSPHNAEARLATFFAQSWVQRGDPEALFIKRAARRGDRFTSHVAFPGGKQDPEDQNDDRITAVRETAEEVGIDLDSDDVVFIGNLAERIVTAEWGTVPLMVLCPFVFLLTRNDIPAMRLQPSEVHSAHWVPLRALMSPSLASHERADLSDRLTRQGGWIVRWLCRLLVGQLMFGATKLAPSESIYCTSSPAYLHDSSSAPTRPIHIPIALLNALSVRRKAPSGYDRPMLLWGLTHGMMSDFLDLIPHHDVTASWEWPTFSAPDVMFVTWLMTWRFRQQKTSTIRPQTRPRATFIIDEGLGTFEKEMTPVQHAIATEQNLSRASAVSHLLLGYFQIVKRAVHVALLARTCLLTLLCVIAYRRRMQALRHNI